MLAYWELANSSLLALKRLMFRAEDNIYIDDSHEGRALFQRHQAGHISLYLLDKGAGRAAAMDTSHSASKARSVRRFRDCGGRYV